MDPMQLRFLSLLILGVSVWCFWISSYRDRKHTGQSIVLHHLAPDQNLKIEAPSVVTIVATGSSFFALRAPESNETIIGIKAAAVQAGWSNEEDFKSVPYEVRSGVWTVIGSPVVIRLTGWGSKSISATRRYSRRAKLIGLFEMTIIYLCLVFLIIIIKGY
jgi:hypothetical protein